MTASSPGVAITISWPSGLRRATVGFGRSRGTAWASAKRACSTNSRSLPSAPWPSDADRHASFNQCSRIDGDGTLRAAIATPNPRGLSAGERGNHWGHGPGGESPQSCGVAQVKREPVSSPRRR